MNIIWLEMKISTDMIESFQNYHVQYYRTVSNSMIIKSLQKSATFDVFYQFWGYIVTPMMISTSWK